MSAAGCDATEMYVPCVCQAASPLWEVEASDKCQYTRVVR